MRSDDVAEVFEARDSFTAHRVVLMLKSNGIPARVVGDDLEGIILGRQFIPDLLPRVWVPRSLAVRARALIAEMDLRDPAARAWVCPACGSDVDAGFEICWNCQRPRP